MTDTLSLTNLVRLKSHLKKDGLAVRLVTAQMSAGPAGQQAALKKVMSDRLNELRRGYAGTTDQKT
jgi:predicted amino acid racemase